MRVGKKAFRISKKAAWGISGMLAAALLALILWANVICPDTGKGSEEPAAEVSNDLQDFEAECIDGSTFRLSDQAGKVVFINLWATWCEPCVKELPYFDAFYLEHPDDAAVLALHSGLVTEDVEEYLKDKDYQMPVAVDDEDEDLFHMLDGSQLLPQTIVIGPDGEVMEHLHGSVTPELLEELQKRRQSNPAVR